MTLSPKWFDSSHIFFTNAILPCMNIRSAVKRADNIKKGNDILLSSFSSRAFI
jgi:hypothetical protein